MGSLCQNINSKSLQFFIFFLSWSCLVIVTSASFLSAHRATHFHYTVQRLDLEKDNKIDNELLSNELESDEEEDRQGTVTSSSLPKSLISTSYSDCGSSASIKSLTVSPCDAKRGRVTLDNNNGQVCEIERGSNVTFNLSFVPKYSATQLKAVIHGIYDFVPIPFPCPQPDACHNSGLTCPLKPGQLYDYVLTAKVLEKYPRIKLWIKGQLEDEHGNNVICIKIHVQLV